MPSQPIVTVVLTRDGRLHLASDRMPQADAERWADEGYSVFQIALCRPKWAVHHVNTHKVVSDSSLMPGEGEPTVEFMPLLAKKGG